MDQRLKFAAQVGDIERLYALIQEDAHVLDSLDQVPFANTPLHIASAAGHSHFALEIMRLKPSFVGKLNQAGLSCIHLALQSGQTQMVLRLLDFDRGLVRIQGREGFTPLHFAAKEGIVDLLAQLLVACPDSVEDLTIRKETALHVAAKNNRLEALEVLLGWLDYVGKKMILDWTDDEGNNVLHIAASRNQTEMVQLLVRRGINVNTKNLAGLTALDMLQYEGAFEDEVLENVVRRAGTMNRSSLPRVTDLANHLKKKFSWYERSAIAHCRSRNYMSNESRNAVLVVAVLIAAATYQTMLSPPIKYSAETNSVANNSTPTLGFTILWDNFYTYNHAAFFAAMAEISFHLKSLHISVLQTLCVPLIFCYVLLTVAITRVDQLVGFIFSLVLVLFPKLMLYFIPNETVAFMEYIFKRCLTSHISGSRL
ncbi:Transmembrane protein [Parasponia andersonii]|uniref:Transmembrane protein n=1 Tax=Parasponia andersonii TaxID=3476 RepID=A0A2P5BT89_PARAD|nr:Transmembrane protein [Parasponia andersonii]